jgi:DNA polymerase-3 subunit delta
VIYIFWGEDDFLMEEALQQLKQELGQDSLAEINTVVLEGRNLSQHELKLACQATPFLFGKRLVVIKGLIERFEPQEKGTQQFRAGERHKKEEDVQGVVDCIKETPESTMLVLVDMIEVKKDSLKNNPLFNAIAPMAQVRSFPVLTGQALAEWVRERVNSLHGRISDVAVQRLVELIGGNLRVMANEVAKLVAYAEGKNITEEDIRQVVGSAREMDIFMLVDAIIDQRSNLAEGILEQLLQSGVSPSQILVLLARQVQIMIQIKDLLSQKMSVNEIKGKMGIFSDFIWKKVVARSGKYTMERLKEIHQNILRTDLTIKKGVYEGDLALEMLVAELCQKS